MLYIYGYYSINNYFSSVKTSRIMKKTAFIVAFIATIFIISCDNKKGLLEPTTAPISASACDSIRYTNGIKSIIDKNCTQCHSGPFANGGVDLTTYSNVQARALDGRIRDRITNVNNPMPPSGFMPKARVDSVLCWIDKGGPL